MSRHAVVRSRHAVDQDSEHEPDVVQVSIPAVKVSNSLSTEEALKRWCPFVRIREYQEGYVEGTAVNRSFESENGATCGSLCLASGCMAWRWDISHTWDEEERRQEARGYCGLAGQPF